MATPNPVPKLYRTVVEDVINNVRESFLDEGLDEQVLQELKQLWESKLLQSKAVENIPAEQDNFLLSSHYMALQQQQQQQLQQQQRQVAAHSAQIGQTAVLPTVFAAAGGAIDLSNPAQAATLALPAGLYQQPVALNAGNITFQQTSQGQLIAVQQPLQTTQIAGQPQQTHVTYTLPPQAQAQLQATQVQQSVQQPTQPVIQLDGPNDSSSEDEDDYDEDDDKDDDDEQNEDHEEEGEEEDPLNSGDDVSEEDPSEIFDTDNVVVCQYDKINRSKNRWKFHLKDGIMNLNGKDYVFQRANGEAEW